MTDDQWKLIEAEAGKWVGAYWKTTIHDGEDLGLQGFITGARWAFENLMSPAEDESDNVSDLDSRRLHGVYRALCLGCFHQWVGVVPEEANVTKLECSSCGKQKSFAVPIS